MTVWEGGKVTIRPERAVNGVRMTAKERITRRLTEDFRPASLEVVDESDRHKGHGGWREGGETHFRVKITADAFRGLSRVAIHRAINEALAAEISPGGVHALAIEAGAPAAPG